MLIEAGISIALCRDEGFDQADDAIWIPEATRRGYVIVSGDKRQRYRVWEKLALSRSRARVLHVVQGNNVSHPQLAQNFVNTYELIVDFVANTRAPFVATIVRPYTAADFEAGHPGRILPKKLPSVD